MLTEICIKTLESIGQEIVAHDNGLKRFLK